MVILNRHARAYNRPTRRKIPLLFLEVGGKSETFSRRSKLTERNRASRATIVLKIYC